MDECFYFGCWNEPGHYLFAPGGKSVYRRDVDYYTGGSGKRRHLDATLAPRKMGREIVWSGQDERFDYRSEEMPQGHYLCHKLDNGFTAVQWWDRCQGDTRGACNSTILFEGNHTAEEVLAAGRKHFPHVFENLARGGTKRQEKEGKLGQPVELVDALPPPIPPKASE